MRVVQRIVAPLLTGALAAGVLVAVAQADVLPFSLSSFSDVPAQATGETTDTTVPRQLDELIDEGTDFDIGSVFVDLGPVGDFPGIYEYGEARDTAGTENAASFLRQFAPGREDPDGDGPTISEHDAAERFLLGEQCNGLLALAVRRQSSRPVLARIVRPDQAAIDASEPAATQSQTASIAATQVDPIGGEHILPLESVVEVGRVTVSVLDLDLVRARSGALLAELVGGEPGLGELPGEPAALPDAVGTPEFYETLWTSCLVEAAEEGTVPVPQTLHGVPVWSLKRDHPPDMPMTRVTPDIDTVTWLEAPGGQAEGLEIRVESTFLNVDDDIVVDPLLDLDTRTWLEHFADSVEPAMEVASRLVSRGVDELDLLEREAFAFGAINGFEFGDEVHGTEEIVTHAVRQAEGTIENLLAQAADATADATGPTSGQEGDGEAESTADRIVRARSRPVYPVGAIRTNVRRRLSEPPNGFFVASVGTVQMVVWDPEFLNSDAFRSGWRKGLEEASESAVSRGANPELDIVELVVSESEGIARVDYLLPCYSVTVSAADVGTALHLVDHLSREQDISRNVLFEGLTESLAPDPAPSDAKDAAKEAAQADAHRAAFCSKSNLRAHISERPAPDLDGNGIADGLPENDLPEN